MQPVLQAAILYVRSLIMSDIKLSKDNVINFFDEKDSNGQVSKFIRKLDSADNWAADFSDTKDCFELINEVEDVFAQYGDALHINPDTVLYILANITTSRCLYLIDEISVKYPLLFESLAKRIDIYQKNDSLLETMPPDVVKQRFDVVERARLLNVIYNTDVYQRIFKLIER